MCYLVSWLWHLRALLPNVLDSIPMLTRDNICCPYVSIERVQSWHIRRNHFIAFHVCWPWISEGIASCRTWGINYSLAFQWDMLFRNVAQGSTDIIIAFATQKENKVMASNHQAGGRLTAISHKVLKSQIGCYNDYQLLFRHHCPSTHG